MKVIGSIVSLFAVLSLIAAPAALAEGSANSFPQSVVPVDSPDLAAQGLISDEADSTTVLPPIAPSISKSSGTPLVAPNASNQFGFDLEPPLAPSLLPAAQSQLPVAQPQLPATQVQSQAAKSLSPAAKSPSPAAQSQPSAALARPAQTPSTASNFPVVWVYEFFATWCPSCRKLEPLVEAAVAKYNGFIRFVPLSVEQNQELVKKLKITQIPTVIIVDNNGQTLNRLVGLRQGAQIDQILDHYKAQYTASLGAPQ